MRKSALAVACWLLCQTIASAQGDEDLKAILLRDAPKKWKEYRAIARKLQGHITLTVIQSEPSVMRLTRIDSFKQNGTSAIATHGLSNVIEGNPAEVPKGEHTYGQNPKYSFDLARDGPAKNWVVAELVSGNGKFLKRFEDKPVVDYALSFATPQFQAGFGKPVAELLTDKAFRVKGVRRVEVGGKKLVRVEFEHKTTSKADSRVRSRVGWMTLDPERYWHMTEVVEHFTGPNYQFRNHSKYEVRDTKGGYPVIKRLESARNSTEAGDRKRASSAVFEWTLHEADSVPEREFKLSAFGLPEPK